MDILIENLTYKYPVSDCDTLNDISVSIKQGEICAIVGNNGSGKTTLCNAIRGFVPHLYNGDIKGNVYIGNKSIMNSTIGELSILVGYVFQNPFTQMSGVAETVYEEIAFGLENLGLDPKVIKERIENVLSLTKLDDLRNRNPFQLSGGQQQRVALACAIVMDPQILVIDEPTSQLDPQSTAEVFHIIKEMNNNGKTIVLVEHKMELIAEYADQIILLHEGSIVKEGSVKDVFTDNSVLKYNISIPEYTDLGFKMRDKKINISEIPTTYIEAKHEMDKLLMSNKIMSI